MAANPTIEAWIILAPDGQHGTVGRFAPPVEEKLAAMLFGLERAGFSGGWRATIDGPCHGRRSIRPAQVRPIGTPDAPWAETAEAFAIRRRDGRTAIGPA